MAQKKPTKTRDQRSEIRGQRSAVRSQRAEVRGQSNEELKALRQEIESLKEGQSAIQKTLDEIKELLKSKSVAAQPQPATPPQIFLDIAGAPVKGNKNARVVLVDFSDYQ